MLFQQDNARPHTARISQQALRGVQMLPWPAYSPDFSPIEHVWDLIGRRLQTLSQPRTDDQLWQMVDREWRTIPQDTTLTLIDSVPRACFFVHRRSRWSYILLSRCRAHCVTCISVREKHQLFFRAVSVFSPTFIPFEPLLLGVAFSLSVSVFDSDSLADSIQCWFDFLPYPTPSAVTWVTGWSLSSVTSTIQSITNSKTLSGRDGRGMRPRRVRGRSRPWSINRERRRTTTVLKIEVNIH